MFCPFLVTLGCGSRTTENCTYFESATSPSTGACRAKICKADDNICQIRLDFLKFVITGPATTSASVAAILNGQVVKTANGKEVSLTTQCLTDTFTVSGQVGLPYICGTMTGHHGLFVLPMPFPFSRDHFCSVFRCK